LPLLFERAPALRDRIAWLRLADGTPTPIERLARLGERLGIERLFVKRDDRTSAVYGGNKVRKLEWILAEARRRGRRRVVTVGAWGSHHALATAIFARAVGLDATLVLTPQPLTPHVRANLLADLGAGARVVAVRSLATAPLATARALLGRPRAFFVAPGGSDARGTLGYVECALEIAEAVRAGAAPAPDFVYVAAGTCGTAAGLALGLGLAAREVPALAACEVVGVRVVPRALASARRVGSLARKAARLLERAGGPGGIAPARVTVLGEHLGAGYGHATEEGRAVAATARAAEGLALETTYTAKALAGLAAFAAAPARRGRTHLFVHTLNAADLGALAAKADAAALPAFLRARLEALTASG
jgi:1-aminocyclopropane-1-carboxylate deaminase/D-cysteine desulfhydrase-like pyridoxal-dependent ACC family enzyme